MLIRIRGYNAGVQEYLEEGTKAGREFSRDELDERVMLDGDLDLTRLVYESIEDKGQDRYLSITLAFREDEIPYDTLLDITQEFKQFLMSAYKEDEFNFYAEAHLPKIKQIQDRVTGELIERKPHIHIVIPRKNMLSGNEANPAGMHEGSVKYLEAFQEYINQKYALSSPREFVRADIKDAASVLSRYKGDDFYGKNREFKQELVKQVIERGVVTRPDFYALVAEHGETRIRNEGKDSEYIAIKLPGDAKFTNLKDTIFQDDFIVRRELKKPPLDKKIIQDRLLAWPQRAKEIKYISKANPAFRKLYTASSPDERLRLLADRERTFYQTYGDRYGSLYAPERERDHQRSPVETESRGTARVTPGVQNVPVSDVATHGQAGQARGGNGAVLLPGDALLLMGQSQPRGDPGLRPPIRAGGGRGSTGETGRRRQPTALSQETDGRTRQARTGGINRPPKRNRTEAPPYPRNPHRVDTIFDIEARSQRLFGPLKRAVDSELIFKQAKHKPLAINREASTVAAYFNREIESNQLLPPQRNAIRRVNKQFFELRRSLFSDDRLTRQDKAQLVSVLTFERMKAREVIKNPELNTEVNFMGSADIRRLVEEDKEDPGYSISGPKGLEPVGIREQVRRIVDNLGKQLHPETAKARERELSAKDIYTRKARFSQNVHYLDKQSDKTLFVDTGKAISLRRTGITESGVAVALKLAQERFGSTLTITGSAEFKHLVIEAAAKSGMDVHFTDKDMNQSLAARRAELEIERDGQGIAPGSPEPISEMAVEAHTPVTFVHNGQRAVLDLSRYTVQPEGSSPEPSLSELMRREAAWRKSMEMPGSAAMSEADVRSSDTVMGLRGEDHAIWLVATNDKSPDAMAMISSYMENDSYREAFKGAIEDFYTKSEGSPDSIRTLDEVTDFVVPLVNEIESKQRAAALVADIQPEMAKEASDRKVIQGELIDHGAAPYQNKLGKEQSYFATVKTDAGNRTLWGAGLQETLQDAQVKSGDRVRIEDKGTVPVTLQLPQVDGSVLEKPGFRREWAAERMPVAAAIAVEAVTIVHNGEAVVLDPANSNDVVKYNDALTADVSFQADNIVSATQSLGELESMLETHYAAKRYEQANMLDSGAVSHGPEYVDKLNADIENVKSFLDKSKASLAEAQTSLQKLTPIATGLSSTAESPASLNFTHMGQQASLGLTPSATAMPAPLNFEPSDDVAPRDRDIHIGFLITDALASFVKVEADPDQKQTFIAYLGDEVIDRYGPGVTRDQAHGSAIGDAYAFFTHGQLIEKLTALELQGKAEAAPMSASLGQAEPEHDHGPELN